jgi:hypothetical protein
LIQGPGPDAALGIDNQGSNRVAGQRARLARVVPELLKLFGAAVPPSQPAAVRGEPQIAVRIFGDRPDVIAGESVRIAALASVLSDRVAVITV